MSLIFRSQALHRRHSREIERYARPTANTQDFHFIRALPADFIDIGDRAGLVPSSDSWYYTHLNIDEDLSKDLGMLRLGLKYAHLQTPTEENMGGKASQQSAGQDTKRTVSPGVPRNIPKLQTEGNIQVA